MSRLFDIEFEILMGAGHLLDNGENRYGIGDRHIVLELGVSLT